MRRLAWVWLALSACGGGQPAEDIADTPPGTDIWLASLGGEADGGLHLGEPANITNREGYDNQPYFLPDGSGLWYTVVDDAGAADIWIHDLRTGMNRAVTTTAPESEYSATPRPGGGFSAIRVEADSTQRLWAFDEDGSNATVLLQDLAPVGYHAWADDATVVMFVLGDPATLQVGDVRTGRSEVHGDNIGRSIQRIPDSNTVSFVQRVSADESWITRIVPATGEQNRLIEAIEGGDFHAWTPGGTLLMGHGSRLYQWRPGDQGDWHEVADLSHLGIEISRLAVSPDGSLIAIVGEASD
jgi:hypothetical protein